MKKWFIYLVFLGTLIAVSTFLIAISKASFMTVENLELPYKKVSVKEKYIETRYHQEPIKPFPVTSEKLPNDLVWENGLDQETFSSVNAKRGGVYNSFIPSYPQTFRQTGINSNTSFRKELDTNCLGVISIHPNTYKPMPALANAWAVGKDKRTVYYKIDPDAEWSDGVPVTADDFIFMLKLYRSKGIIQAWYNDHYSNQIEDILKFDDHTIAIRLPYAVPRVIFQTALVPQPYHFYGNLEMREYPVSPREAYYTFRRDKKAIPEDLKLYEEMFILRKKIENGSDDAELKKELATKEELAKEDTRSINLTLEDVCENWNKVYNWKAAPNTGAYYLHSYMRGNWVKMKRKDNWWANDKKFYKYCYNPDWLNYSFIADIDIAFEYFKQAKIDAFALTLPKFWYKKANNLNIIEKGYAYRVWFWNDIPRPARLLSINVNNEILKDKNVRLGIAHSLNFRKMIDNAMLGDAIISNTIAEGYQKFTNDNIKARTFDPLLASEYFEKAGFNTLDKDGFRINADKKRLSFKLFFISEVEKPYLLILQEEARKSGLEFTLETFDANTVFSRMLKKDHDLAWHGWAAGSNALGPRFKGEYHGKNAGPGTNNFSNIKNANLDKLIDRHLTTTEDSERIELSKQIQQIVHDEVCSIPTYIIPFARLVCWRWLVIPNEAETHAAELVLDSWNWWIDTDKKEETEKAMKDGKTFQPMLKIFENFKIEME